MVHNCTPVPRPNYRVGVPIPGTWSVALNSDAEEYAGSGAGCTGDIATLDEVSHGEAQSLCLDLPPLGSLVLRAGG
ncbi:1,4-alpha-glucan branching enzyme GlgB [compost metagenome]